MRWLLWIFAAFERGALVRTLNPLFLIRVIFKIPFYTFLYDFYYSFITWKNSLLIYSVLSTRSFQIIMVVHFMQLFRKDTDDKDASVINQSEDGHTKRVLSPRLRQRQ